jgi:thymidylate synthase (FAD)
MKLIKPSVEIIPQKSGLQGMYEHIEKAGRVCYKSENLIKYDDFGNSVTARDFVDRVVNVKKHGSIAEHGTVYLKIRGDRKVADVYYGDPYSRVNAHKDYEDFVNVYGKNTYYITTNYRVILERHREEDLQYICEPTEYHDKRITVRVICPISVSREWNRHRAFSVSEKSTRYCNYSKDKFNNELTFCKPYWMQDIDIREDAVKWLLQSTEEAEDAYLSIIDDGFKPQEAREVLPLCTATEVIYTGYTDDWEKFFDLRCANTAHPDIRNLATELRNMIS